MFNTSRAVLSVRGADQDAATTCGDGRSPPTLFVAACAAVPDSTGETERQRTRRGGGWGRRRPGTTIDRVAHDRRRSCGWPSTGRRPPRTARRSPPSPPTHEPSTDDLHRSSRAHARRAGARRRVARRHVESLVHAPRRPQPAAEHRRLDAAAGPGPGPCAARRRPRPAAHHGTAAPPPTTAAPPPPTTTPAPPPTTTAPAPPPTTAPPASATPARRARFVGEINALRAEGRRRARPRPFGRPRRPGPGVGPGRWPDSNWLRHSTIINNLVAGGVEHRRRERRLRPVGRGDLRRPAQQPGPLQQHGQRRRSPMSGSASWWSTASCGPPTSSPAEPSAHGLLAEPSAHGLLAEPSAHGLLAEPSASPRRRGRGGSRRGACRGCRSTSTTRRWCPATARRSVGTAARARPAATRRQPGSSSRGSP